MGNPVGIQVTDTIAICIADAIAPAYANLILFISEAIAFTLRNARAVAYPAIVVLTYTIVTAVVVADSVAIRVRLTGATAHKNGIEFIPCAIAFPLFHSKAIAYPAFVGYAIAVIDIVANAISVFIGIAISTADTYGIDVTVAGVDNVAVHIHIADAVPIVVFGTPPATVQQGIKGVAKAIAIAYRDSRAVANPTLVYITIAGILVVANVVGVRVACTSSSTNAQRIC